MIKAALANDYAQMRNRDKWIEATLNAISNEVEKASHAGLHKCYITISLYIGAQNLLEAAEMLAILYDKIKLSGYDPKLNENGTLVLEW